MSSEFYQKLLYKVVSSLPNDYTDNYDTSRFGEEPKPRTLAEKVYSSPAVAKRVYNKSNQITLFHRANQFLNDPQFPGFAALYDLLANEQSKDLLVALVAYRMLGHKRVKLPLNNDQYWERYKQCDDLVVKSEPEAEHYGFRTQVFDLNPIGMNLKLRLVKLGILIDFMVEQYKYKSADRTIEVKPGDVVIDGGGFWGDTALYFATKAGAAGKVYTFEFIPGNIKIFRENLAMNPEVAGRVEIVEHPLWEKSDIDFYYLDKGPASAVSMEKIAGSDKKVKSKTIDTLVKEKQLDRVDFIKMDIEGAEPYALRGAEDTIRRFRPKLAIAVYHSVSDFVNIPADIHSLGLGYKLYLGHYTMQHEETLIYATTE